MKATQILAPARVASEAQSDMWNTFKNPNRKHCFIDLSPLDRSQIGSRLNGHLLKNLHLFFTHFKIVLYMIELAGTGAAHFIENIARALNAWPKHIFVGSAAFPSSAAGYRQMNSVTALTIISPTSFTYFPKLILIASPRWPDCRSPNLIFHLIELINSKFFEGKLTHEIDLESTIWCVEQTCTLASIKW